MLKKQQGVSQLYRTILVRAKFNDEEKAFWVDQCQHANSLINCAIYHTRQTPDCASPRDGQCIHHLLVRR